MYKKDNPKLVENYRPIYLICIVSKIFKKKSMYVPLYNQFKNFLSKNQRGFVRKRSVMSNLLQFLKEMYVATDNDLTVAFYKDFSDAFDTMPDELLNSKPSDIGVIWCFLENLYNI